MNCLPPGLDAGRNPVLGIVVAIVFGIIGAIVGVVDHLQTKRIKAEPGLMNTK